MPKISGVDTGSFSKINGINKTNISKVNGISGLFAASPTPTPTRTPTPSVTPSVTPSISVSPTRTPTVTPSVTPSITPTSSVTPTVTPTSSPVAASPTPTPTVTPSPSPCNGISLSVYTGTTPAQACYNFPNPGTPTPGTFGADAYDLGSATIIYLDRTTCSGVPPSGYYYDWQNSILKYWDGSTLSNASCPTCNTITVEFGNMPADICNGMTPPMQQVFVDVDVNNLSDSNYLFQSGSCYQATAQPGYYTEQLGGGAGSIVYYWNGTTLSYYSTC